MVRRKTAPLKRQPKLAIEIHNTHATPIEFATLRKITEKVWRSESTVDGKISLVLGDDDLIKSLNRQYLGKNSLTDVIAFPLNEIESPVFEGEIYVSLDRVKANADYYDVNFDEELMRVTIHGLLHLLGYDDRTKVDKNVMKRREDFYLE